jgi:hypothetical protein
MGMRPSPSQKSKEHQKSDFLKKSDLFNLLMGELFFFNFIIKYFFVKFLAS